MKKYFDGLRSFDNQLKQIERGNSELTNTVNGLEIRKKDLVNRLCEEQQEHSDTVNSMLNLRSEFDGCMAFIKSIPLDLRKQLIERYEYLRDVEEQRISELDI
jgi:hypothetical protein